MEIKGQTIGSVREPAADKILTKRAPATAAADDDDGAWDDNWDEPSMETYHGNKPNEEGGASGQNVHGPSVKISLNK